MAARPHRSPHQVMRYAPILRLVGRLPRNARVLEVGAGDEGLGTWSSRRFVGLDLSFSGRIGRTMLAVQGDAVRLPFRDRAFDLVVCPGVLHFLEGDLQSALAEIGRVTGGRALAVVPCGAAARASDRRNVEWCRRRRVPLPRWFREQMERGLPECATIRSALAEFGEVREGATISVGWNERLFRIEQRLRRAPGAMTAIQPIVRLWGRARAREWPDGGPVYESWFLLDTQATDSPPLAVSE